MDKDDIGLLRTDPVLNQPKEDLAKKKRVEKCPFCRAKATKEVKWSNSTTYDYACDTEGVKGGFLRSTKCYERQLAHQANLLREALEVVEKVQCPN